MWWKKKKQQKFIKKGIQFRKNDKISYRKKGKKKVMICDKTLH